MKKTIAVLLAVAGMMWTTGCTTLSKQSADAAGDDGSHMNALENFIEISGIEQCINYMFEAVLDYKTNRTGEMVVSATETRNVLDFFDTQSRYESVKNEICPKFLKKYSKKEIQKSVQFISRPEILKVHNFVKSSYIYKLLMIEELRKKKIGIPYTFPPDIKNKIAREMKKRGLSKNDMEVYQKNLNTTMGKKFTRMHNGLEQKWISSAQKNILENIHQLASLPTRTQLENAMKFVD